MVWMDYLLEQLKVYAVNAVSAVRTQFGEENWLDVNTGVRQGGVISPLLFIHFMDKCMKELRLEEGVTTPAYTDDIELVANNPTALQNSLTAWDNKLKRTKMKINTNIT